MPRFGASPLTRRTVSMRRYGRRPGQQTGMIIASETARGTV
jgi:hypothetical protein